MTAPLSARLFFLSYIFLLGSMEAGISIHGNSDSYTETGGDWMSMGSNDISSDGQLGSDGYLFYGNFNGSAQGGQSYTEHVGQLPSYVSSHQSGGDFGAVVDEYGSYGSIDSPLALDGTDEVAGIAIANGGADTAGATHEIMSFTIDSVAEGEVIRIGVLAGVEGNVDGRWDPTSLTLSDGVNSATVGDHATSALAINPGGVNAGWVFFDVNAAGTYTISGTQRIDGNDGPSIGGITFDSVSGTKLLAGRSLGIDFGDTPPVGWSNFNHFSDTAIEDGVTKSFVELGAGYLKDTEGSPLSGVGFSVTNKTGKTSYSLSGGTSGSGEISDSSIYSDALIANDNLAIRLIDGDAQIDDSNDRAHFVLTFTGLDDDVTYNLTGGFYNNNSNFNAIWQSDGENAVTDSTADGYITLTDLSTDGSGNLVINVIRAGELNGQHVALSGFVLEAVDYTNPDGSLNFPLETPENAYTFPNAFPNLSFTEIASLESLPGHPEKLFVVETRGVIWMIPDVTAEIPTKVQVLNRSSVNTDKYLNGMGGVAFHPDFDTNGYIYVTYPSQNNWTRLSRFTVSDPSNITLIDNATEQVLIQETFHRSHGWNRLMFGPDGYLYVPIGDGKQVSHQNRPADRLTQTIDEGFWSSILRIDVDKKPGNYEPQNLVSDDTNGKWTVPTDGNGLAYYSIPADNPFLNQVAADGSGVSSAFNKATDPTKVRTEMYAIGFRNPWKIGFVPGTSDLWVADVMASLKERYMIIPKGGNAGWAFYSGTSDVEWLQTTYGVAAPTGVQYVQPVVEYYVTDNDSGSQNKSIIGGEFYQSSDIPTLTGAYIMCDYNRGDIWAVHREDHSDFQMVDPVLQSDGNYALDDVGITETTLGGVFAFGAYNATVERLGVQTGITAMLPNPTTGEMLLADSDGGGSNNIIRKLVFSNGDFDSHLPQTLTETGAFEDVETFEVTEKMLPYDVNLTFWSDGASKSRYFNMVDTSEPMTYSADDFWEFPTGMVTMKHFDMDLDLDNPGTNVKRIETRFLVKSSDGFYGMTYQWNDEGTEATLVGEDGVDVELRITEGGLTRNQTWRIPSRGQCYQCHHDGNNVMLGFNSRQLNHLGSLEGEAGNFLSLLENAGYLSAVGADPGTLPVHHQPGDDSINIQERVKSYLAVNCAYCHYEGNGAVPDSWSGQADFELEQMNLLHGEAIGAQVVDHTDRLIVPGDTANSIILSRASATNDYGRMPPVGSNVVDSEGVALITEWIQNYANAKPMIAEPETPLSVTENSVAQVEVGSPDASDPDAAQVDRGTLTYSIIGGNADGIFTIDANTGVIRLAKDGPDYEEASQHNLTIQVTDGFSANPGTASAVIAVAVNDIPNDDSQGDGIADEWALAHFGSSSINPFADSDQDGAAEILEYWGNSDPLDASDGFVFEGVDSKPNDGYYFEWVMRDSLLADVDYLVKGNTTLGTEFSTLTLDEDYTIESTTAVDGKPGLSRVRIKVTTASDKYFLQLSSP
ncbi:PQQ-dependent sugar dehydrogenase [Rubritalea spongiae]|uniref:PQQ-dependent sugar dehydrogenase n=1 Tax=Rubritalea spongiae TaxID=430797 RepID=A0ABW5E5A1_9BACT